MSVLLILADGMRPDAVMRTAQAQDVVRRSAHTMRATTVSPSVTLPCHMSLFHSVEPSRHGTTTNIYAPQVRPVKGLCETLVSHQKTSAFYYSWEELRDLTRPGSLHSAYFNKGAEIGCYEADALATNEAIRSLREESVDFRFLYLESPDALGHKNGWMSEPYLESVADVWTNIGRVLDATREGDTVIITADHGGHDRVHGSELPEDMLIPLLILGDGIEPGSELENASILDIAPTVAAALGVPADEEWEGRCLL